MQRGLTPPFIFHPLYFKNFSNPHQQWWLRNRSMPKNSNLYGKKGYEMAPQPKNFAIYFVILVDYSQFLNQFKKLDSLLPKGCCPPYFCFKPPILLEKSLIPPYESFSESWIPFKEGGFTLGLSEKICKNNDYLAFFLKLVPKATKN